MLRIDSSWSEPAFHSLRWVRFREIQEGPHSRIVGHRVLWRGGGRRRRRGGAWRVGASGI